MSIEWIEHKDKKILYINYGGMSPKERLEQIQEATNILVATNSNKNLTLTDMRDTYVDNEFLEKAKENGKTSLPLTYKAAVIGVTGIKKLLLNVVNSFSPKPRVPFDSIEEAKDWLVE